MKAQQPLLAGDCVCGVPTFLHRDKSNRQRSCEDARRLQAALDATVAAAAVEAPRPAARVLAFDRAR